MISNGISAVFVGTQSLLIRCLEHYLGESFDLRGVISADPAIKHWALDNGIPFFQSERQLLQNLEMRSFDYLFSVANLDILSDSLLALPAQCSHSSSASAAVRHLLPEAPPPQWGLLVAQQQCGEVLRRVSHGMAATLLGCRRRWLTWPVCVRCAHVCVRGTQIQFLVS